jgi:D-glycero-alpha-D-manno-heptose-7-phosphate kinase
MSNIVLIKTSLVTRAQATTRVWDIGGWLDTWFAVIGEILNIGVWSRYFGSTGPFRGVEVSVEKTQTNPQAGKIEIIAADPSFDVGNVEIRSLDNGNFDHSNILLDTLYLLKRYLDPRFNFTIRILSPFPPGASVGTSAAVEIALGKAITGGELPLGELAKIGWRAETEIKGGQSGIQDHWGSDFSGGVGLYTVSSYPETTMRPVRISDATKMALNDGLVTVCYGTHDSSEMHNRVISGLEGEGEHSPRLARLRGLALQAEDALRRGYLTKFGRIGIENTEAQKALCPELVSQSAEFIIQTAKIHKALGWKVNGAGGEGGSITVLMSTRSATEEFVASVRRYAPSDWKIFEHRFP